MRHAMVRGVLVAAMMIGSTMWAFPASAGGGCHGGATQGQGDTVAMSKACFTPSMLRVNPGTEVTFVNKDPVVHNVSATGWGYFEDMAEGEAFTATFDEPGVYPYACTYHAGMTGAIVVGDGTGAGSGELVTVAPLTGGAASSNDETEASEATGSVATPAEGTSAVPWALGGGGGFLLGAASALLLRRRRTVAD
jgi:plastocyanin